MQAGRRLADGVEAGHVGGVVGRAHPDAAHRVVRGRRDLDRLLGDVEHLQLEHRLVHAGQARHDRLARQVRDIQPDAAVRGAAALLDLGVAGQRDAVARGELEPLGVVLVHEALAETVAQDAALAARRLGDEGAGGVLGLDDAARVELHELRVAQAAAGLDGEAERVAGVLVASRRGAAPDAVVPAGGEDHGIRVDQVAGAVFEVEAVGAEDRAVVVHEDARDVHGVEDRHLQLRRAVDQGALDLESGVVAREGGAAIGVRAEEPLRDAPVVFAGERHAVALQVFDAASGARGDDLDSVRVGEQVALFERVGRMLLPAVVGIHRREGGVDAAGGEGGVRVRLRTLAEGDDVDAGFGEFDGCAKAGPTGADHEDGGGKLAL